jgi:uncharacterized protein YyaL (SSP411 family)
VDWYPWGDEAFAVAQREGKPVFLSVGYSTCHWCHVMERESFRDEEVAAALKRSFIAVKVDREERPDVDAIYMKATQLLGSGGGWPNSVWLTPDRKPFYAGTYFPRGRFLQVLSGLAEAWKARRKDIEAKAEWLTKAIARLGARGDALPRPTGLTRAPVEASLAELAGMFDGESGGFGRAPKFPPHQALALLLYEHGRRPDSERLALATRTLDGMARGQIHDQVGGGFHRYATRVDWDEPHFEKMLYDNGMLLQAYAGAYLVTREPRFLRVAEAAAAFVLRELTGPEGEFYSGLDADDPGGEGAYYRWTREELERVLAPQAAAHFAAVLGVNEGAGASEVSTSPKEHDGARQTLLELRAARPAPFRDDKVLTSWNALTIRAFAYAGRHLERPGLIEAAQRAARFVLGRMRSPEGRLRRSHRLGKSRIDGYLDDHAAFGLALVELHEATGDATWLRHAEEIAAVMRRDFLDPEAGGFFYSSKDHEVVLVRSKEPQDSALPSGNGLAAQLLVHLARLTEKPAYRQEARRTLECFAPLLTSGSFATLTLSLAQAQYLDLPAEEVPAGTLRAAPLSLHLVDPTPAASSGGTASTTLVLRLDEGWHVNSARPNHPDLVATRVSLAPGTRLELAPPAYPGAIERALPFLDGPLSLYEGEARIGLEVRVPADSPIGPIDAGLELRVQACDERRCLAPTTHVLPLQVRVAPLR